MFVGEMCLDDSSRYNTNYKRNTLPAVSSLSAKDVLDKRRLAKRKRDVSTEDPNYKPESVAREFSPRST